MNKPVFPKPKCAAAALKAEAELQHERPRAKWVGLHDALALLTEARELADENAGPAGETDQIGKAGT
jgi:hypothetical protein